MYKTRPGGFVLSAVAFAGLVLFSAVLWQIVPGFVLLLMIPALLMCLWQMVVTPVYGLHLSRDQWHVFEGPRDRTIPTNAISHIQIDERDDPPSCSIVLHDGGLVRLSDMAAPAPMVLIREATNRGIPIRQR